MRARNRPENVLELKPEPESDPKSPAHFQLWSGLQRFVDGLVIKYGCRGI